MKKQQLSWLLERIETPMFAARLDGVLTDWNEPLRRLLGVPDDRLASFSLLDDLVWDPDERTAFRMVLEQRGSLERAEVRLRRPDGMEGWARINVWVTDRNGPGQVLGLVHDVTARHRAEQELRATNARFRALFNSLPVGVLLLSVTDGDVYVLEANPSAERILGMTSEQMMNTPLRQLQASEGLMTRPDGTPIPPEEFPAPVAFRTGAPVLNEVLVKRRPGHPDVWTLANAVPLDHQGSREVVAAFIDITPLRSLERELVRAQRWEYLGLALAKLAHDFNNVLQGIGANIEVLQRRLNAETPERKAADLAVASVARGKELTARTLEAVRSHRLERQSLDIGRALPGWLALLEPVVDGNVRIKADIAPGTWPVFVEPSAVRQLVENLVVNAGEAMPDGGLVTVRTRNIVAGPEHSGYRPPVQSGDAFVELRVEDEGTGIAPEVLPRIFDPLFTTKTTGTKQGTGVGLMVVESVLREARGHVHIETELGRGTTFSVLLPRHDGS